MLGSQNIKNVFVIKKLVETIQNIADYKKNQFILRRFNIFEYIWKAYGIPYYTSFICTAWYLILSFVTVT